MDREEAKLMGIKLVKKQLDVKSDSTIWRWVEAGLFPKPVKLGAGATRWRASDIEDHINSL